MAQARVTGSRVLFALCRLRALLVGAGGGSGQPFLGPSSHHSSSWDSGRLQRAPWPQTQGAAILLLTHPEQKALGVGKTGPPPCPAPTVCTHRNCLAQEAASRVVSAGDAGSSVPSAVFSACPGWGHGALHVPCSLSLSPCWAMARPSSFHGSTWSCSEGGEVAGGLSLAFEHSEGERERATPLSLLGRWVPGRAHGLPGLPLTPACEATAALSVEGTSGRGGQCWKCPLKAVSW